MQFSERVLKHAPWSISKAGSLEQCVRAYHKRYVLKLKEQQKSAVARLGTAGHKIIERARVEKAKGEDIDRIVREVSGANEYGLTHDETVQMSSQCAFVEDYCQRVETFKVQNNVRKEYVEYQLAINASFAGVPFFDNRNAILRGVIDDAFWTQDDILVVVDHKSGRRKPIHEHATQFYAYMLLALGNHPGLRGVQCAINYFGAPRLDWFPRRDGSAGPWTRTEIEQHIRPWLHSYLEKLSKRLAIVDAGDPPPELGWSCEYCGFTHICEEGAAYAEERRVRRQAKLDGNF